MVFGKININGDLLQSITSTIELFLEDFESNCLGVSPAMDEKKKSQVMSDKITESPRITQTRVS